MAETSQYDVFLSHNSEDRIFVMSLAKRLEDEAGLRTWLDKWHLIPGEPWQEGIEAALDQCRTYAIFLGPSGFGAWHHEEMRSALSARILDKKRRVIPVLLPGSDPDNLTELPRFLFHLTWVDFRGGLDDQDAFRQLVAGVKGISPGRDENASSGVTVPKSGDHYGESRKAGKDTHAKTVDVTGSQGERMEPSEAPGSISNISVLNGGKIVESDVKIHIGHSTISKKE
jgi:hypothetical protein